MKTSGLCESCRFARTIVSDRGSQFTQCSRSRYEAHLFPKYPKLPVLSCDGYEKKTDDDGTDQKIAVDQNE